RVTTCPGGRATRQSRRSCTSSSASAGQSAPTLNMSTREPARRSTKSRNVTSTRDRRSPESSPGVRRADRAMTRRIGMGLVGPGFVGVHHIDAVRRLGFVDVVAIAASSEASARRKADALSVPKAYGSYQALIADPDVHVVHNTTPNHLHVPVIEAALASGKHVISDKPLAMTSADARRL